jgi:ABC-2 type transport system ATP-binding protein
MPQERGLYAAMPAGEQVVHFGRLHGLSRRDAPRRARDLLDELGLADRWSDRTESLSGACASGCSWPRPSCTTRR